MAELYRRELPFLLAAAALSLSSCDQAPLPSSNYGDLLANPERYLGKQITIKMSNQYLIDLGRADIAYVSFQSSVPQTVTAKIALATIPGKRDKPKNPLLFFYAPDSIPDITNPDYLDFFNATGTVVQRDVAETDPTGSLPFAFFINSIKDV